MIRWRWGARAPSSNGAVKRDAQQVLAITMHGDAAFAGQGVWAETLNMSELPGYNVGGSIHIVVNNLIGFTTAPRDSNSSRFCSDIAKRLPIPIFHVNAEDFEAVVRVGRMALDYRYTFGTPVVIDLVGYRRHGHSEVDDPTITQPLRYRKIEAHPPTWQIYTEKSGIDAAPIVQRVREQLDAAQKEALELEKAPPMRRLPRYWNGYKGGRYDASLEVDTGVAAEETCGRRHGTQQLSERFSYSSEGRKTASAAPRNGAGKTAS